MGWFDRFRKPAREQRRAERQERREQKREGKEQRRAERHERRRPAAAPPSPPPPAAPQEPQEPAEDPAIAELRDNGWLDNGHSGLFRYRSQAPSEALDYIRRLVAGGVPGYIPGAIQEGNGWAVYCDRTS